MRAVAYLFIACLLAACAWTPAELRQDGIHVQTSAQLTPAVAARCLQRRIEDQSGSLNVRVTPLDGTAYEVLVRREPDALFPSTFEGAQMLFELWPDPRRGSRIEAWFTRWTENPTAEGVRGLLTDCR